MKKIDNEVYYSLQEVCMLLGKSRATILRWYEYERSLDEEERVLPEYVIVGGCGAKYFRMSAIKDFNHFMSIHSYGDMKTISNKYNGKVNKCVK